MAALVGALLFTVLVSWVGAATPAVRSAPDSKLFVDFVQQTLQTLMKGMDDNADLMEGCIGYFSSAQLSSLPQADISNLWLDVFPDSEVEVRSRAKQLTLDFLFPHIIGSAELRAGGANATQVMYEVPLYNVSVKTTFKTGDNGSRYELTAPTLTLSPREVPQRNSSSDSFDLIRHVFHAQIVSCVKAASLGAVASLRLRLSETPLAAIDAGTAVIRNRRIPRQTNALNRIVDRVLRDWRPDLREDLRSIEMDNHREEFSRSLLGEEVEGEAEFRNGRMTGADRLRRRGNCRSYERRGRWYVRVYLQVRQMRVRYRATFKQEDSSRRETRTVRGRSRRARATWIMSQPDSSTGPTVQEEFKVNYLGRVRFSNPSLRRYRWAWNRIRRPLANKMREMMMDGMQKECGEKLEAMVEGSGGDDEDGSRRVGGRGGGSALFQV